MTGRHPIRSGTTKVVWGMLYGMTRWEKTIDFIKRSVKKNKPFFAFVPFTHAHLPVTAHPDFSGKTGNGSFADVLAEIGYNSGEIIKAIDKLKIKDNTPVIWLSDNGPEEIVGHHGTAGYWRGNYFTALEGSLRVPALNLKTAVDRYEVLLSN